MHRVFAFLLLGLLVFILVMLVLSGLVLDALAVFGML